MTQNPDSFMLSVVATTTADKMMPSPAPTAMAMSDKVLMMKQVEETHHPDGREFEVEPLLDLVEDILDQAKFNVDTDIVPLFTAYMAGETLCASVATMLRVLSYTIGRISGELSKAALTGGEAHQTTLSILNMLAPFSWYTKPVLTLAAFAFNYGEFWLLSQVYSSNQLARSMAFLKQQLVIMDRSGALESLSQAMLEATRYVVDLKELSSDFISSKAPVWSAAIADIPNAVYWTTRSAVACASRITYLTSFSHKYKTSETEDRELSTLVHKVNAVNKSEKKWHGGTHQTLLNLLEAIHVDNMKILKSLIYPEDDILPLVDGTTKRKVNIEVLKKKNVWLLISELDISQHELSNLKQIYSESKRHTTMVEIPQHEVVWIPVVDRWVRWTNQKQKQFETLQSLMPWYTVRHRSLIEKAVIWFIKEKWHFRNKPILVVLDPQGRVVCPNAIHMMWIWGSNAFPFTTMREEALWKEETWRLEFLVSGIDQTILHWISEGKYIFLYGGDDIEWIRKFTTTASQVAVAARIPLEMVYVGKSNGREQVRQAIATINDEKLSYTWQDLTKVWLFWTRLESMLFSKIQLGKADERDPVMQQIKRLLSFDKDGGWAVLSKGSSITVNGQGTTVLQALLEYDLWKEIVAAKGYDGAFKEHHDKIQDSMHLRCRLDFHSTAGQIPDRMRCPECPSLMEELTAFLCCHDEVVPSIHE